MKKRLTLDETWVLCLWMWKWIASKIRKDPSLGVESLKAEWVEAHGYEDEGLTSNCFFCDYAQKHYRGDMCNCPSCPARKIDPDFDCMGGEYSYTEHPLEFYAEIRRLNNIRLKRRKAKRSFKT